MYHYLIPIFISIPFIIYFIKDELLDCCSRDYKKHKLSNQQLDNLIDKFDPTNIVNKLELKKNL